jgi:hypothetical protein
MTSKRTNHKSSSHNGDVAETMLSRRFKGQPTVLFVLISLLVLVGLVVVYKSRAAAGTLSLVPSSSSSVSIPALAPTVCKPPTLAETVRFRLPGPTPPT